MRIAFDIDDTLIIPSVVQGFGNDVPNYETIAILRWFQAQGHEIFLWSGSGTYWAFRWGTKLGLEPFRVLQKQKNSDIDICFDDCDVDLAKVNVKVKRIKNSVSRAEWNKTKKSECCGAELEKDVLGLDIWICSNCQNEVKTVQ